MRYRIIGAVALLMLVGCSQTDQTLPFEVDPGVPVVGTTGTGATVVSTPAGLSMSVPAGALPEGSGVMVTKLDKKTRLSGGLSTVGDIYLIGFEGVPQRDPAIEFSFSMNQGTTAGGLVGMVPLVVRVPAPGQRPSANMIPAGGASYQNSGGELSAQEKFDALMRTGVFNGLKGEANIGDEVNRAELQQIFSSLSNKAQDQTAGPVYQDVESGHWSAGYKNAVGKLNGGIDPEPFTPGDQGWIERLAWELIAGLGNMSSDDVDAVESAIAHWTDRAVLFAISPFIPFYVPVRAQFTGQYEGPVHPLLPAGATSATFELVCTAIEWPNAGLPLCDGKVIDVRAGAELLDRYPISVVVPSYLNGEVTLQRGGAADGTLKYGLFLRVALATGITGVGREDELDLSGSWSVRGDTLTVGGHRFRYSTPDASSLVIAVSDSVWIKEAGGQESWQQIEAYLKLRRR